MLDYSDVSLPTWSPNQEVSSDEDWREFLSDWRGIIKRFGSDLVFKSLNDVWTSQGGDGSPPPDSLEDIQSRFLRNGFARLINGTLHAEVRRNIATYNNIAALLIGLRIAGQFSDIGYESKVRVFGTSFASVAIDDRVKYGAEVSFHYQAGATNPWRSSYEQKFTEWDGRDMHTSNAVLLLTLFQELHRELNGEGWMSSEAHCLSLSEAKHLFALVQVDQNMAIEMARSILDKNTT